MLLGEATHGTSEFYEMRAHYFRAALSSQFDKYVWFDETTAVDARVDKSAEEDDLYELFPFGL